MARMTYTNGVVVKVSDDKVDRLLGAGFSRADEPAGAGGYATMKVDELREEIVRRNDGREEADQVSTEGKKADLIAALEADDSADE